MSPQARRSGAIFDPKTVGVINRAYRGALDHLATGIRHLPEQQNLRVTLGEIIVALASAGERDESRLRERALFELKLLHQAREQAAPTH